ncbi:isoprenylcysteine carboxylmethyltransferase family protein [Mycolicibacter heraklionensis]|uniref:Isoprenylcysteine carboxylmethyltransferase family protein n=1 Tax=Mycolicibacter heraklionensis TaxID=512402 RepID=A0A9X7WIJ5_9MYCO|nr:isoprenylcysteine carboxylmethyltransferase family protein [Mycolicibacter heraklionensis]QZA08936.1 isoprenylcysteine carboxylmethyltransferase family protein [Mycolicibacter heraklionensis]
MKAVGKGLFSAFLGLVAFGLLLFVPAGTVHYWQAWVFLAVFAASTWIPSVYLMRTNPAALDRRMQVGPLAETRPVQRIVITAIFICFPALFVLSAVDHRLGWSTVPTAVCLFGDVLVAAGLVLAMAVVIQNGYAAANVTVEAGQALVSTGLYGLVRHPMYTGNVLLMAGTPLALGSYWGLVLLLPGMALLIVRIFDEERLLTQELSGYREYTARVRYRLLPYVW